MASSGSRSRPEPWIPATPDNEREVAQSMRAYRDSLVLIRQRHGIPGLMAELTRINAAQQELASRTLAGALTARLDETVARLDSVVPRSRPTASPSAGSERGRGALPSPSPRPGLSTDRSRSRGLGPAVAERIAMAQIRAEARRAEREGF